MKILWLCNLVPGCVQEQLGGKNGGGLWIDHALSDLRAMQVHTIRILSRGAEDQTCVLDDAVSCRIFRGGLPHVYPQELEPIFREELTAFQPDVIHIWGTEFGHTLAMVNTAIALGMEKKVTVSIQGLCSYIAYHYAEGVPYPVQKSFTLRDFLRQDNILQQQKKFALRGESEKEVLRKVSHAMGRTKWDRACLKQINPELVYSHCGETLRETFYSGKWDYASCRKHQIMAPNCYYPVKGFHYLLKALAIVLQRYPDATLVVPGDGYFPASAKGKLLQDSYRKYMAKLTEQLGLRDKVSFLGSLDAEAMKQAMLQSHVFALSSTIENSSNSLGEAMLLGVPCVAADVGGVSSMLTDEKEGYLYPSSADYMLADRICHVFELEEKAEALGASASKRAAVTHDPQKNLAQLLTAYASVMKG